MKLIIDDSLNGQPILTYDEHELPEEHKTAFNFMLKNGLQCTSCGKTIYKIEE